MSKSRGVIVTTSSVTPPGSTPAKSSQPLLMAYKELFGVVFKIPHESVKTRVLNAILAALNGDSPPRSCHRCLVRVETTERSSQTTFDEVEPVGTVETDTQKSSIISVGGVVKLGRKRRVLAPQASTGTDLGVRLSGRQKQRPSQAKRESRAESTERIQELTNVIVAEIDTCNVEEMIKDLDNHKTPKNLDKTIRDMMLKDWIECVSLKDGKLPIHFAVQDSDEIYLRRQCLTLKHRRLGVDLKTSDGYTALHIALLTRKPDIQIVELLLVSGANVATKDPNGNNCVLLAGKYTQDLKVFTTILRKTPFSELQCENFLSHGIFRVVVDSGRVDFLNELIKYVDECLGLQSVTGELKDEKEIGRIYRERLKRFVNKEAAKGMVINEKKAAMLNQRDKTAGKTPLFCAVEKQKEIIVLVLLGNFADPRIMTHAGVEPYMLANEVLKNKKISTNIISAITAFENLEAFQETPDAQGPPQKATRKYSRDENGGETKKRRKII